MSASFLTRLHARAQTDADAPALAQLDAGGGRTILADYATLVSRAADLAADLAGLGIGRGCAVGLAAANGPTWVELDLALQLLGAVSIPVPLSFSRAQVDGLLARAEWTLVDGAGAERLPDWSREGQRWHDVSAWSGRSAREPRAIDAIWREALAREAGHQALAKIIHTSGTTGAPKGVMVSRAALDLQSAVLGDNIRGHIGPPRYLSLLPLSLLIEQLFAINVTLIGGGCLTLLPPELGPLGDGRTPAHVYLDHVRAAQPSLLMVPPAIVDVLAQRQRDRQLRSEAQWCAELGVERPPMICCGGAPASRAALAELADAGLPVYEGYGLSEATAVVCWNQPGATKLGSVGRPSDHNELRLGPDGELLLRSPTVFLGYAGRDQTALSEAEGWLATGDLATMDDEGYVTILGRKKDMIITSTGRNVSPSWVEGMLVVDPAIANASVFGDGLEQLVAVVASAPGSSLDAVWDRLVRVNASLPEFAQLQRAWLVEPDSFRTFQTPARSVDRAAMWAYFGPRLAEARPIPAPSARAETEIETETMTTKTTTTMNTPATMLSIITPAQAHPVLGQLDRDRVLSALAERGVVLLRDFGPDLSAFSAFVERFCTHVTFDPAREGVYGSAQEVDAGFDAVGLHLENGFTAFPPELVFFLCETAAARGSQTTVCDGRAVWAALSEGARTYFETHDIKVRRVIPEPIWRAYVANELDGIASPAEVCEADLDRMLAAGPEQIMTLLGDRAMDYALIVPGKTRSLFDDAPVFANSLLGPHYNYERPQISDRAGEPIPAAIMAEVRAVTAAHTRDIEWRDGDVVVIDNRRVMHGRRAIVDPMRKLYIGLGNL